jgi:hypothetical protein
VFRRKGRRHPDILKREKISVAIIVSMKIYGVLVLPSSTGGYLKLGTFA